MSNRISLQEIPTDKLLEGYIWWSDKSEPEIFLNTKAFTTPTEGANPFIIEGNFWNKISETSYLIRFIDGEYLVYKFEFKDVDKKNITELDYLPHRMPEVEKLKFKEVWIDQPDINCLNFNVLKPAFIAFVGFIKNKEVKK